MEPEKLTSLVTLGGFIATVLSAIAALGSAIAAGYAIKQSILQRTVSTKPQIILGKTIASIVHVQRKVFDLHIKNKSEFYYLLIPVKNIGLGAALNIRYKWNFNYKNAIQDCGFKEIKEHPLLSKESYNRDLGKRIFFSEGDNHEYYGFLNNGTFTTYPIKIINNEIEYLLPISQDKTECTIKFPVLILTLLNEISQTDHRYKNTLLPTFDAGQLHIHYNDISGNNITIKFQCNINTIGFISSGETGPESTFRIDFHTIEARTTTGLRKLRKSYAEFIEEHDFNKNSKL